jgi:hypothetical protein
LVAGTLVAGAVVATGVAGVQAARMKDMISKTARILEILENIYSLLGLN